MRGESLPPACISNWSFHLPGGCHISDTAATLTRLERGKWRWGKWRVREAWDRGIEKKQHRESMTLSQQINKRITGAKSVTSNGNTSHHASSERHWAITPEQLSKNRMSGVFAVLIRADTGNTTRLLYSICSSDAKLHLQEISFAAGLCLSFWKYNLVELMSLTYRTSQDNSETSELIRGSLLQAQ